ncbi:hypothetical protein AGMMS49546_32810 [Spirochaetia bacterium]|nr:hypothetical protein AGMMS49546_32810 [Spirochaetia bacterium]
MEQQKNFENNPNPANDDTYEWLDDLGSGIADFVEDTTYAVCDFINNLALTISGL